MIFNLTKIMFVSNQYDSQIHQDNYQSYQYSLTHLATFSRPKKNIIKFDLSDKRFNDIMLMFNTTKRVFNLT